MMSLTTFLAFIAASALLALVPGPSMAVLITNSTTKGLRAGFVALAGNGTGLAILVTAAILGMAPLLSMASQWLDLIRMVGAVYLVWLGFTFIRNGLKAGSDQPTVETKSHHIYGQALAVCLSNPKVLLFLGAFFPQFIDPSLALTPQLIILGLGFVVTILTIDALIVLMSSYARRWLLNKQRETNMVGGLMLVGAGAGLAISRQ